MKLKRRHKIVLAVVAVLLVTKTWLFDLAADAEGTFAIDVAALHHVATAAGAAALPTAIEVETIAHSVAPRSMVVAGAGLLTMHPMVMLSHRVVWPDRSLIIDTALGPNPKRKLPGMKHETAAYQRMLAALPRAERIVFTHEHLDHVGGIAAATDFATIKDRVAITSEQITSPALERDEFAPGTLAQLEPFSYRGLHALAPGVVLQHAPGHSQGTQLIYVALQNGKRFLFVGDIAWSEDNIELQRGKARLPAMLIGEDRGRVAAQLRALAALPKDVHVVVAHDDAALRRDLAAGLFRRGFSGPR